MKQTKQKQTFQLYGLFNNHVSTKSSFFILGEEDVFGNGCYCWSFFRLLFPILDHIPNIALLYSLSTTNNGGTLLSYSLGTSKFTCKYPLRVQVLVVVQWLAYTNSLVNPIVYTVFNEEFRNTIKKIISCSFLL